MKRSILRHRLILAVLAILSLFAVAACSTGSSQKADDGDGPTAAPTTSRTPLAASVTMNPPDGATGVNPAEPLTLTTTDGILTEVAVTNQEGKLVAGALAADLMSWTSSEPLGYAKTYSVAAKTASVEGVSEDYAASFQTLAPENMVKATTTPSKAGGTYGVGMLLIARFDEPIPDKNLAEQYMVVTTAPAVEGAWYWVSDKEARWRPAEYYAPGTAVSLDINIYGKDLGGGLYGQQNTHTDFVVGDSMVSKIDNSDLQLRVYQNGSLIKTMPASMGSSKYPSQSGIHIVQEKYEMKIMDSSTWGLPTDHPDGYYEEVPYATRISQSGEFVHSAPWSVADQGVRNVSHGCINLSMENGKWFYHNATYGDIVVITGTGVDLKWSDGYSDWNIPWETWVKGGKK